MKTEFTVANQIEAKILQFSGGIALAATLAMSTGCATAVSIQVLQPAQIDVPSNLQALAVIDRSQAKGTGEKVLAAVEGLVTGEQLGVDQAGRQSAISAAVTGLSASPRFKVSQPSISSAVSESDLLMSELSPEAAKRICARFSCDGIVALELFDSDSEVQGRKVEEEYEDDKGNKRKRLVHEAVMEVEVTAAWRLYDAKQGIILDYFGDQSRQQSFTEKGGTFEEAASKLPNQESWVSSAGQSFGAGYATRIAPTYIWVSREYYSSWDDRLKKAKDHVAANDWAGASAIWQGMLNDPDTKNRGKALYNLAVAKEVEGDLEGALNYARQAIIQLNNGNTRNYQAILMQRIADRDRVRKQLAPPPAPDPNKAPPPPKAGKKK